MLGVIGKKVEMSRMFDKDGNSVAYTIIEVLPLHISQIKTEDTDNYNAIQVAYGEKREKLLNKPFKGHLKKANIKSALGLKEFRVDDVTPYELGQEIKVEDVLSEGDNVDVIGYSKGKGFQGVMKRHGFHGGRATHGSRSHRIPGSIGQSASPSRVHKNKRLPGHMGNEKITVKNLKVLKIAEMDGKKYVAVKGAVPGSRNGIVTIVKN